MSDQKQSQFIEVQGVNDSDYFPIFGQSSNRKISKPNLFDQIREEVAGDIGEFIANTAADLADLNCPIGSKAVTKGCLVIGDGGNGAFILSATAIGSVNGYSCVLSNGNYWNLLPVNGCVDIHQFGIGADLAAALLRADVYCQTTKHKLTGSGTADLATQVTISAPNIDLYNFKIKLAASFPSSIAVIYQAMSNDLNSRSDVALAFDGNYANQVSNIIALKVRATPNAPTFRIFGDQCKTLLNINGNVERALFHITCNNTDLIVLEDGDSPDTNRIEIHGGQFGQVYNRASSTTTDLYVNCQGQKAGVTTYPIEDNGNRQLKISGELRALTYGAVRVGNDPAFVRQSADSTVFDLHVQSVSGGVPIVNIQEANCLTGRCIIDFGHDQLFLLGDIPSADFSMATNDCDYVGYQVIFGIQSTSKACVGSYRISDRGAAVGAKTALFDRVGEINVYFDGSSLPIDITSTVSSDVINMSLERSYVANAIPVTHNGVRANVHIRGQQLTPALTGYLTAVGAAGICRGTNVWNVNTNGLNFFDGTVWKYVTTSTTLV